MRRRHEYIKGEHRYIYYIYTDIENRLHQLTYLDRLGNWWLPHSRHLLHASRTVTRKALDFVSRAVRNGRHINVNGIITRWKHHMKRR